MGLACSYQPVDLSGFAVSSKGCFSHKLVLQVSLTQDGSTAATVKNCQRIFYYLQR